VKIRVFKEEDRRAVIALWQQSNLLKPWNNPDKDISRKLEYQPELFLVAEKNGEIMASVMAGYDGHRGSVYYLAVAADYQKVGVGRTLMSTVESLLKSMGCPKLNIMIRHTNSEVDSFYKKLGYLNDDVRVLGKRLIED
jgi:ribosomal protein S18 acetylase RimI-like enzyme